MATEALQIDALWAGLNDPTTGQSYSGAIVATFEVGTTTPKAVWEDKDKTLPSGAGQSQFTLDSNGQAFVFGDGKYKINIYAATDTGLTTPLMTIDGVSYIAFSESNIARIFDNVSTLVADTTLSVGNVVKTLGYVTKGDGGGNEYEVVAAGTGTDDGGSYIDLATYQAQGLFPGDKVYGRQFGPAGDGTDQTTELQKWLDFVTSGTTYSNPYLHNGSYGITSPLTADRAGLKLLGEDEANTKIIPLAGFSGTYLFDWGNASVSRNRCEIKNIGFDSNGEASITAIRWRRINNTSKIMFCSFENLAIGIEFDDLALANTIAFNRFHANTINVKLIETAGNSTTIFANYIAHGQIYLNNAMTDVKILSNTFDNSAYVLTDGASGPRGVTISANRFESPADVTPLQIGLCRGLMISGNSFLGSNDCNVAINLSSAGATGSYNIHDNYFEEYLTSYVVATSVQDGLLSIHGNQHDGSAPTPYDTNDIGFSVEGLISEDNIIKTYENTKRFGEDQTVIEFYVEKAMVTSGVAADTFTITVGGVEQGAYTCIVEGMAGFAINSTATAAMSIKGAFAHTNGNDGGTATGAVTEVYKTASAATASGTRDVTDIVITAVETSDTVLTVQSNVTWTGSLFPTVAYKVTLVWNNYDTIPTLTAS